MFSIDNDSGKNSNLLGVRVKNYGECSYCLDEDNKVTLNIPWNIWSQWICISRHIGGKEWGGVFWVKGDTVASFRIPKQEVTSTECEFKEELGGEGIVHSHHNMGAFHSSQDDHHARNLYEYSIVISNTKGCEATKRIKLPCGGFGYVKVELHLIGCPDMDFSKITEKRQEFMPDCRNEHHQQLNFGIDDSPCIACVTHDCENCEFLDMTHIPCESCDNFKCKTCRFAIGRDCEEMLPFCDFCEDEGLCGSCSKLAKYLENYPEDRKHFEYLYANQI